MEYSLTLYKQKQNNKSTQSSRMTGMLLKTYSVIQSTLKQV